MKKSSLILILFLIILTFFIAIHFINEQNKDTIQKPQIEPDNYIDSLWQKTVHQILEDPLWQERDAYDAGHFLMVPLHSAFVSSDQSKMNDFHQFFERFANNYKKDNFDSLDTLTQLHFLYLTSQYLSLNKTYNVYDQAELEELIKITESKLLSIWEKPAWHWKQCNAPPFENMGQRIQWKLQNKKVPYGYCRAIIDEELFTIAIAADVQFILEDNAPDFVSEILDAAYKVFKSEVVFPGNNSSKWLFQPGVWEDHPDYAYAGWDEIKPNLDKKPVLGIAWDTSHFHRFPLWLISLQKAFEIGEEEEKVKYFQELRYGLAEQFLEKVLVKPSDEFPNYRTNNFMDGWNGVYRYGYITQGEGKGCGPYELSGTMLLGWWSFLPGEKIRDVYCYISSRFPLSEEEIKVYLGPDTTRDRHPSIKSRAQFEDGLLELISKLICKYGAKIEN